MRNSGRAQRARPAAIMGKISIEKSPDFSGDFIQNQSSRKFHSRYIHLTRK